MKSDPNVQVEYVQVVTEDRIQLDAWINKPANFDPNKSTRCFLCIWGAMATTPDDSYGDHNNFLWRWRYACRRLCAGYLDNCGTPALKGAAWRKAIYRKNGQVNIRDMAMGAKNTGTAFIWIKRVLPCGAGAAADPPHCT